MNSTRVNPQQLYGDYLFGNGDVNENGKSEYCGLMVRGL